MQETIKQPSESVVCKFCQSTNTRKYGFVEGVQTYFCNSCKRKFKADDRLFRMKTPANQVSSALSMYYEGMSINAIRRHLLQEYQNFPSSKTVYEWIQKYTDEVSKRFRDYHPQVGNVWIADETVLDIDGKNIWMYDIIDEKTRFLLATRITTARTTRDAQSLMEQAEKRAGKRPSMVVTDKQNSYLDGIELAYGMDTEHVQSSPFAPTDDTQRIERFHGTLKARTKVMRGLKSIDTAIQFVDGYLVHYNFLRPHEALSGRTPAEESKVDYTIKTWADVTRMAHPQIQVLTTPAKVDILSERKPLIRPITNRTYDTEKKHKQRIIHRRATVRISRKTPRITPPAPSLTQIRKIR
ncbi:MAG: IS6 family transposase [Chloroflexi bacterium]|nr:IS6 family transposase [Chloroflexota bacterium]